MVDCNQDFVTKKTKEKILSKLEFLYGERKTEKIYSRLVKLLINFKNSQNKKGLKPIVLRNQMSHKDSIFITYPDSIQDSNIGKSTLKTLRHFTTYYLKNSINIIHILPFFLSSSDRGFSVIDYKKVNSSFGTWEDIKNLKEDFNLIFDFVCNHTSNQSGWFKKFSAGDKKFKNFFIAFTEDNRPNNKELGMIFRPRAARILVSYNLSIGKRWLWRTFLKDQLDLNYKDEKVLLQIIEIFLFYIDNGADLIRLDAVAFLWKKIGTNCIHLSETHTIVQLFRDILDIVAPNVMLITETNVPYEDNISYFGKGMNEAQVIYNFALPPLVIHTIHSGDASQISEWADDSFKKITNQSTFINFLDSHDGIGLIGAKNILNEKEIQDMADKIVDYGGLISYKEDFNGKKSLYEINSTWWNAINSDLKVESEETKINRYLASRAIALSLRGVPGIYIHGLLGSSNSRDKFKITKNNRDINRKNLNFQKLALRLKDINSRNSKIFYSYLDLIKLRSQESSFHPGGEQKILFIKKELFSLMRRSPSNKELIFIFINISNESQKFVFDFSKVEFKKYKFLLDIISKRKFLVDNFAMNIDFILKPYEIFWLKPIK